MIRNNIFHMEAVVGERIGDGGEPQYLVKWAGYDAGTRSTWEPEDHILANLIADWIASRDALDGMDLDDSVAGDEGGIIEITDEASPVFDLTSHDDVEIDDVNPGKFPPADGIQAAFISYFIGEDVGEDYGPILYPPGPEYDFGELRCSGESGPSTLNDGVILLGERILYPSGSEYDFGVLRQLRPIAALIEASVEDLGSQPEPDVNVVEGNKEHQSAVEEEADGTDEMDDDDSLLDALGEEMDEDEVSKLWPGHFPAAANDQPANNLADTENVEAPVENRKYCNDPAHGMFGLIQHSAEIHVCDNPGHIGSESRTYSACSNAAIEYLTVEQRDAYDNGALIKLCMTCTQIQIDLQELNPDWVLPCTCRAHDNCCYCLWSSTNTLLQAKLAAQKGGANNGQCFLCRADHDGSEWMHQCASCRRLKA
jgi:hypothetical protein